MLAIMIGFGERFFPYVVAASSHHRMHRVIVGTYCDKERMSQQLGGDLIQDKFPIVVVISFHLY